MLSIGDTTQFPTLADFKEARDLAKSAHETLDASVKLLSKGIYHVIDVNDGKTPLFDGDGNPRPEAEVPNPDLAAPAPTPEADLTVPALGCAPREDGAIDVEIVEGSVSDLADVEDVDELAEGIPPADDAPVVTESDRLFEAAKTRARETGKTSTKAIRAEFSVGYEKAKAIMERLFAEGIINEGGEVIA
jgi:DNA segregation ATPase FtsK/SpoIIIE-like protein